MATGGTEQLFIIVAAGPNARRHARDSLESPVRPSSCEAYFGDERGLLEQVKAKSGDGQFYAWGARNTPKLRGIWDKLHPGDYVLVYQGMEDGFTYWTRVIEKRKNREFAAEVWGVEDNETWELMYFLERLRPIPAGDRDLSDLLGEHYQGFTRVGQGSMAKIRSLYGSVGDFVSQRFGNGSPVYLLLRSQLESDWQDDEGKSYHYGDTVANYKKVTSGAYFLLDRRSSGVKRVLAKGRIETVSEEPASGASNKTFRAAYKNYEPLKPPKVITDEHESELEQLDRYNNQHSIRVLSKEVFEKLAQPARAWIFQGNPNIYDVRAAVTALQEDTWLVLQHRDEIEPGDRVYIWESGPEGGIVAIAEVIDRATEREEGAESAPFIRDFEKLGGTQPRVRLRILEALDPVVKRADISSNPELANLSILRQSQGTNFPVTKREAEVIEDLLTGRTAAEAPPANTDIENIMGKLEEEGFYFPSNLVKNYYLSIKTKPFVLLTGMSGGGKTALTRLVAEGLGEPYCVVAVKPNWTDSRNLLGFYNPISQQYVTTEALSFIIDASKEYEARGEGARRFHLCLDEMNLSHVEYYFAELLSAMERPDRRVVLHSMDNLSVPGSIILPLNLVVLGTVNVDETVQPFSDKVKDRANTITVPIDLDTYVGKMRSSDLGTLHVVKDKAFSFAKTEQGQRAVEILLRLHRVLSRHQVHFGYRIMDEVLAYLAESASTGLLPFEEALDAQVEQKVLPKVRGRGDAFRTSSPATAETIETV